MMEIENKKKYEYKRFFLKGILFFGFVFLLDLAIGKTLEHFYFKQESGLQYRTTYSMEKTTADVLVFGSSRANHHYHPEVFEEKLKMSYYNVGRDGNFIFYHYAVLKAALQRYTPKIIILDIGRSEFKKDQGSYDRLSALLPYYRNHEEIHAVLELKSEPERLKLLSNIYPYNSMITTIAIGNTQSNKTRKQDIKGYVPLTNKWEGELGNISDANYEVDSTKIKYYEAFLDECVKSKTKIYVICSPYYINFSIPDHSLVLAKLIAESKGVKFFDYSHDEFIARNPEYFSDTEHLNDSGAIIYSKRLLSEISKIN